MEANLFGLKLALLFFWAAWFSIVFLTNLFGGLKAVRILPQSWKFSSRNYEAVQKAVAAYRAPSWLPGLLFTGVIVWQLSAAALYAWAFASSLNTGTLAGGLVNAAFALGLGLWAAFMIADEITLKYEYERSHELLFIAQLVTLVALYVLPQ